PAPARSPRRAEGPAARRRRTRPSRGACAPGSAGGARCRRGCCRGRTRPADAACDRCGGSPSHPRGAPQESWRLPRVEPGMSSVIAATRFSVLDRSRVREGHTAPEALRDTVDLAREAERLGYHRFWVAEHHGVPGVAGSAPTVLAAAVAGATRTIRVGTGGVMLPNHRPLVVAAQFGVLEALFPGRIDMGLGRSVGF